MCHWRSVLACLVGLFVTFGCAGEHDGGVKEPGTYPPVRGAAPDAVRKCVVVPVVKTAVMEYPAEPFIEVLHSRDGRLWLDGKESSKGEFYKHIGSLDLPRVKSHLRGMTAKRLLITAYEDLPWGVIDGTLYASVYARMPHVSFAVRKSEQSMDVGLLPTEFPWLADETPSVTMTDFVGMGPNLILAASEGTPVVAVTDARGGPLPDGPDEVPLDSPELSDLLKELAAPAQSLMGETKSWRLVHIEVFSNIPYRNVVSLIEACREAGFDKVVFRRPEFLRMGTNLTLCSIASGVLSVAPAVPSSIQREMSLPVADMMNGPAGESVSVHVAATWQGKLFVKGTEYDIGSLKTLLYKYSEVRREMNESTRPSAVNVLITADARLSWDRVRSVMMTCADPAVRIYRIYWSVQAPDGEDRQVDVFLPKDRGLAPGGSERIPQVNVTVEPGEDGGGMVLSRGTNEYGGGDQGLSALTGKLKKHREDHPGLKVLLECSADLAFGDVVKVLEAVRGAGVTDVRFSGR